MEALWRKNLYRASLNLGSVKGKSAEIVGITWVTLFYWRHNSALKQMDFKQFAGIDEVDET